MRKGGIQWVEQKCKRKENGARNKKVVKCGDTFLPTYKICSPGNITEAHIIQILALTQT
jgi:hypothetical protein